MDKMSINQIKPGWYVNHPKHGNVQYRGLVTLHPFTDEPKVPHEHLFWQHVDEKGNTQPDIIETDGKLIVEVTDKIDE